MGPKPNNKIGKDSNDSGIGSNPKAIRALQGSSHIVAAPHGRAAETKRAPAHEGWMEKIKSRTNIRTVTANELTSLSALIAYAAHKSGTSEFRIERDLADRFNIANVTCLPAACFEDAMHYLVDRVPV